MIAAALRPAPAAKDGLWVHAAVTLLFLSIALLYLVSPTALFLWGFDYAQEGGGPFEKVHPGTWVAALALAMAILARPNPGSAVDDILGRPRLAVFLATCFLLITFMIFIERSPFTPMIDTFLLPVILFLLIVGLPARASGRLALFLHLLLNLNSILGLFEYLTGFRLTPFVAGTLYVVGDWRSTAFIGHPLSNALLTGAYVLILSVGGGRDLPWVLRPVCLLVSLAAMVAFGGRTALILTLLLLALVALHAACRVVAGARFDVSRAAVMLIFSPVLLATLLVLVQTGFFERLLGRFANDSGSASTRLNMLKLLDAVPLNDLMLGPDQALVASVGYMEGFPLGIEDFWLSFIMAHGLLLSLFFFAGFLAFCWELAVTAKWSSVLLMGFFLIVISASVGLAAKTCVFGMFVAMLLTMLRRDPEESPTAHARGGADTGGLPSSRAGTTQVAGA